MEFVQEEEEGDVMAEDLARELAEIDDHGEEIDPVSLDREGASSAAASRGVFSLLFCTNN